MKTRLLLLFSAGLLAVSIARADSYSFKEPFSRTGPFNANGAVTLENVNGNVDILTWDKNEISIEGEKSAKTEEELKAIDLKIDLSQDHAAVKVRLPKRSGTWLGGNSIRASVRFTITVPATANLERIETVNANVTVAGIRGDAKVHTVNGGIRATDVGGGARFETVNGRINATFKHVAPDQKLTFETVNGSVHVGLPKDASVALRTSVVNGHVDCDFPLTLTKSSGKRNLNGNIGDGRASLEAETVNGSIHIEQL